MIPTIAGVGLGGYSALATQEKRYRELMTEQAMVAQEFSEAEIRHDKLNRLIQSLQQKQGVWRTPKRVMFLVEYPSPSIFMRGQFPSPHYMHIPLMNDSIHFYLQANDNQLSELVDRLIERYPQSDVIVQVRILECLKNLPAYVHRERLEQVEHKIREFAKPLTQDSNQTVAERALHTLRAYDLPRQQVEEE
ncbi:hypothetical protein HOV93_04760 [Planctomycetes bacterium FF15]|uniref:Uncharacterized protein n=1 Tax=Bremerella alba TaxID=980252 RepID=A0A7V9A5M1_9BACT|nr:hypothetical protein [Bremerella alba]